MIGSNKDKVRAKIEKVVMNKEWSIKEIMNLDDSLHKILEELYEGLSLKLIVSLLDSKLMQEIEEDFMYNATAYAKQVVSSYLDEATVDLKTSKLNVGVLENDNNNTDGLDSEITEEDEDEGQEQIKEMIRADVKQLSLEEMKERGMVD
jgi:hypothetical protein